MATKATIGTVQFEGTSYEVRTSMSFASFYIAQHDLNGERKPLIRFHKSEASAQKGTWDGAEYKRYWIYQGYTAVAR